MRHPSGEANRGDRAMREMRRVRAAAHQERFETGLGAGIRYRRGSGVRRSGDGEGNSGEAVGI